MSFYERYAQCCKERNIAPNSQNAADQLGCSKSNISFFAKSQKNPGGDIIARASVMLNVSADYLLGLIDSPLPLAEEYYSSEELQALSLLRGLNEEGQSAAIAMLNGLAAQEIYKKYLEPEAVEEEA